VNPQARSGLIVQRWLFVLLAAVLVGWSSFEFWPAESVWWPKLVQAYAYELQTYDYLCARGSCVQGFDDRIRLVGIDDAALQALGQWPWSRRRQAQLVERLRQGGARAAGFDVLFTESSQLDPAGDEAFATSLGRFGKGVLACKLGRQVSSGDTSAVEQALVGNDRALPLPGLRRAACGTGFIDVDESAYEVASRVRSVQLMRRDASGHLVPSLDLAVYAVSQGIPLDQLRADQGGVWAGSRWLPTGSSYEILVPFLGATGGGSVDRAAPASFAAYVAEAPAAGAGQEAGAVLASPQAHAGSAPPPPPPPPPLVVPGGASSPKAAPPPPPPPPGAEAVGQGERAQPQPAGIDPRLLKDSIVLVGAWAPDVLGDVVDTPVGEKPGLYVHAMVLNALLAGRWIRETPLWLYACMLVGLPLLMLRLLPTLPARSAGLLVAVLLVVYWGGAVVGMRLGWWLRPLGPSVNLLLAAGLVSVHQFVRGYALLRQFITPELAHDLLLAEGTGAYTTEKDTTIIFSDIRGFTTLNETMRPSKMVGLLKEYHSVTIPIYEKHGGRCLDYLGDAQMVVFGDQTQRKDVDPNHAAAALRAALEVHQVINELNARWIERGDPPFDVGLGCCSGIVAVGVLGADTAHLQYTVIGDVVNTAARVQGLSRELEAPVIATASTIERAGERARSELIREVSLKGKALPVAVYRVLGVT
jgi:adenylate cyclase